jgi:outer membrane protein assembly factor BamA
MKKESSTRGLKPAIVLALGFLLFAPQTPAQARANQQAPQAGTGHLESVTVTGSVRYSSDKIGPVVGLQAGQMVTKDDMQAAANRLAQLGPFADVQFRFSSLDEKVKVEYQVKDSPGLSVNFDNFPWFTDEEIATALRSSIVLFDGTAPDHGTILDEMSLALERLLMTRGVSATVTHEIVAPPPPKEGFVVLFRVEGAEVTVEGIEFSDALAKTDHGIQDRISDVVGKPFSRSAIELFELEQVRPVYLSHGFLRVKFGLPAARFAGHAKNPPPNHAVVVAPVDAGPAFMWDGVTWSRNVAISSSDLNKLVDIKQGELANGMRIEGLWNDVQTAYGRAGYLDVNLKPVPHLDDSTKRVHYDVSITEGPQYRMGNLVLTGLSIEGERRIRAAWGIAPGEVFDESKYEEFLDEGIKQAFLGLPVHYEKIGRYLQKDPTTAKVDVLIDFQ